MKSIPLFLQHTALVNLFFFLLVSLAVLFFSISAANFAPLSVLKNATIGRALWFEYAYRYLGLYGKERIFFLPVL